jgi:dipeptidyl aminopeptidase/acylaminoacyl peptidase
LSDGRRLYWLESRPEEGGRHTVVRDRPDGSAEDISPKDLSVRSRVHEYGGGAYCLVATPDAGPEATGVAFVDRDTQRVFLDRPTGSGARALSPEPVEGERWNHGDLRADARGRWVFAVREVHRPSGIARDVVAYGTADPGAPRTLCTDRDFFAAPRPDMAGNRFAWMCWDHPDMPWDNSELWVGELTSDRDGLLVVHSSRRIAGGRDVARGEGASVGQPLWCADGSLAFISEEAGWWQPWRWSPAGTTTRLCDEEAEFHGPDWLLGQSTMAERADGSLVCRRRRAGIDDLIELAPNGRLGVVDQPCVSISQLCAHENGVAWIGSTPLVGATVWIADGATAARSVGEDPKVVIGPADVSVGQRFGAPSTDGTREVRGLLYSPKLAETTGPVGARPPLVVFCHAGPTGSIEAGFDPVIQFFTTRGFAVAGVDYAGSTGYGRAFRRSLEGGWGIVDVDDCVAAARYLVERGRVDGGRLAIRGSSAGGFTALCAMARHRAFAGAVSWYGVTDLLALSAATHDFESHYNERLVGPLPETAAEYRRRSPVHRVADMVGAVLVLQGLDDPVVPPAQATAIVAALKRRGLHARYLAFAAESHGFGRAETIAAALRAELAFYQEILDADDPDAAQVRW